MLSAASGRTGSGLSGGYQQLVLVEVLLACCHSKAQREVLGSPFLLLELFTVVLLVQPGVSAGL